MSSFAWDKRFGRGRRYLEILSVTIRTVVSSLFYLLGRTMFASLFSAGLYYHPAISRFSSPMLSHEFSSPFSLIFFLTCFLSWAREGCQDSVSFNTRRNDWICKFVRARAAAFDRKENWLYAETIVCRRIDRTFFRFAVMVLVYRRFIFATIWNFSYENFRIEAFEFKSVNSTSTFR